MRRLLPFLKPYLGLILVGLVFLFVQANANLALPDYLSRIVNVGIQQNGVETALAEAVREEEFQNLILLMTPEERRLVEESYQLVQPDSSAAEDYLDIYPVLENQGIYILQDLNRDTEPELEGILTRAFAALSGIQSLTEDPSRAELLADQLGFDPSRLPAGTDPFQALASMPEEIRTQLVGGIGESFEVLGENMVTQMAVGAVRAEYQALGMDPGKIQSSYILRTGGVMLLISLLGGLATVITGYLASRTAAGAARDIREAVFRKVESFSSTEFSKFSTASLITRSTNDITQVQTVIFLILRLMLFAPIIGIGGIIRAIEKGASMWWLIALAVGVLIAVIVVVFLIAVPKFKLLQEQVDRLNLVTRENLSGMMVIRAFNKQDDELIRFDGANRDLTDTSLFVARVMVSVMPLMMLIMNGLTLAIIWVGAQQVAESAMQVGDMIAFMQYAMQIVFAFLMMSMMFIFIPRAAVSGERIADVLDTELAIEDPAAPASLPEPFQGEIEFKDVCFRYPDAQDYVLRDISFIARPGETTAFIGSTGCGKSTVVNLIPRFFDVSSGSVTLDGIDVRDLRQADLRERIGFVPQQGTLFSGTIESNLQFGDPDASPEDLESAASIAQARGFILEKEGGYQAEISQGGTNVSGGQRQRLAIARALVKQPPIFIFDDSFSALDFKTDSALRKELKMTTAHSAVLIVTQRVATVKSADKIIVLDEGRVVGQGTHQELLESCQTYQEIASSQLSEEELR